MAKAVKGTEDVLQALNREIYGIHERTLAGLLKGGLIIQRDAQLHVPVEYGVLKQSAYTRPGADKLSVEVGFSAAYAGYVHENLEMKLKGEPRPSGLGVYWGPRGEARFLANAVERTREKVLKAIQKDAEIKGRRR